MARLLETVAVRIRHLDSSFTYICIEKHNKNHLLKKNIRGLELLLSAFTQPFLK